MHSIPLQISFLFTSVINIFGYILGSGFIILVLTGCFMLSPFFLITLDTYPLILGYIYLVPLFKWSSTGLLNIDINFYFDNLAFVMILVVSFISLLVNWYSVDYMEHDVFFLKFFSYLGLFTLFMLILVTSDNYLQTFIGWEGVGVCSFLLISFWYTRILATKAALKAMIMNRIADVVFSFAIVIFIFLIRSVDFTFIFLITELIKSELLIIFTSNFFSLDILALFLLVAAVGKSAQLGLHVWLPDAMEGPTPVSSLLHAATMVTAGVFLLLRSTYILEFSQITLFLIYIIGIFSSIFAGFIAIFLFDIKKVVAYSTFSQIGYMFAACGLSLYSSAIFHLFNHAFFKALLFLACGSVIHGVNDEQDVRRMGGLIRILPVSYVSFFIGGLSIMGFLFLTGFYSKDVLLELIWTTVHIDAKYIYTLAVLSAFLTGAYSCKVPILIFVNYMHLHRISFFAHENERFMLLVLLVLMVCSINVGYWFSDYFLGYGNITWTNTFFLVNMYSIYIELISFITKNVPLVLSLLGVYLNLCSFAVTDLHTPLTFFWTRLRVFFDFFSNAGYFNKLYDFFLRISFLASFFIFTKLLDKVFIEFFGVFGAYKLNRILYINLKEIQYSNIFLVIGSYFISLFSLTTISNIYVNRII